MKKMTVVMLLCLMVLGTMTIVQAATNKAEKYVRDLVGGEWNSAYATAYFDYESGRFDHHGPLERVNQPSSTETRKYSAYRTIVETSTYYVRHEVQFKVCYPHKDWCSAEYRIAKINSPGSY